MIKVKVNGRVVSKHPTCEAARDAKHEIIHWTMRLSNYLGLDTVTSVNPEGEFVVQVGPHQFKIGVEL